MGITSDIVIGIPESDLCGFVCNLIREHGDDIALVDATTEQSFTFNQVCDLSIKFASVLNKRGLRRQEVVAVCCSNCIEYPILVLGAAANNAISTTCNPHYTYHEMLKQFQHCQPKFVITNADQVEKVKQIADQVKSIQEIFTVDESTEVISIQKLLEKEDGTSFPTNVSFDVKEDVLLLPYSSGTTGFPKGVMHTHYSFVSLMHYAMHTKPPMRLVTYTCIPLFHILGILRQFANLIKGWKHIIDKRFNVEQLLKCVEKYKVNTMTSVPPMLVALQNYQHFDKYDTSSLKIVGSGAAPLALTVKNKTSKNLGVDIVQGWGLTEMLVSVHRSPNYPEGSVGQLMPNTQFKVVDPDSLKELGINEDGECWVKGPQLMKGYYKNQSETSRCITSDGWFRTGDIGHYDENGFIFIVDRLKELIKYKAFQVPPAELESVILSNPKVADVGVTGIPDPEAGEVPRAYVVRKDGTLTEEELNNFVQSRVSKYKYLYGGIKFVNSIPKSPTGKILRRKLHEHAFKELNKL
uniref:4-coumarate--CoA ligase 1-like n=1 Tax=Ciona intestinalis TaxID=7719 RepID=UPI000180BE36|nr:4-coumarate--CoA ligase 1-like [Ciona intestinalis]|eukprot:XP_009859317.1 4-coumarate--CoA ligase 1-like [Ciona intestinalis]